MINSVRSDGVIVVVESHNSSILYHFQVLHAPVLVWSDKDFMKVMEYIGKGRLDLTYRYSPGRCKQILFFPLSKMIA